MQEYSLALTRTPPKLIGPLDPKFHQMFLPNLPNTTWAELEVKCQAHGQTPWKRSHFRWCWMPRKESRHALDMLRFVSWVTGIQSYTIYLHLQVLPRQSVLTLRQYQGRYPSIFLFSSLILPFRLIHRPVFSLCLVGCSTCQLAKQSCVETSMCVRAIMIFSEWVCLRLGRRGCSKRDQR